MANAFARLKRKLENPSRQVASGTGSRPPQSAADAGKPYRIEILVDSLRWTLIVTDLDTGTEVRRDGGMQDCPLDTPNAPVLTNIGLAMAALKASEKSDCRDVVLYVEDSEVELFDNRLLHLNTGDATRIGQFASDFVGAEKCGYDEQPLDPEGPGDARILAFVSEQRIRQYLSRMDELAIRVRAIVPELQGRLLPERPGDNACATLRLDARHCRFTLLDRVSGSLLVRQIEGGMSGFAQALADANSLPLADAAETLRRRDLFAPLAALKQADEEGSDRRIGGLSRALIPTAMAFVGTLGETLDYFSSQRMADPVSRIRLVGPQFLLKGFADWLATMLDIEVEAVSSDDPDPVRGLPEAARLNLLRGTRDPLIVRGRTRYSFDGERFVASGEADGADLAAAAAGDGGEQIRPAIAAHPAQTQNARAIAMLLPVVLAGGLYLMHEHMLVPLQRHLAVRATSHDSLIQANARLRTEATQLGLARTGLAGAEGRASDKVLWIEKFLRLSHALPAALWLTDTFIVHNERKVGGVAVVTTKLIIRGGAPMDGRDHLHEIARFIDTLEDDADFMSDFRRLTFEGADNSGETARPFTTFEIHAWYDRNRRQKNAPARRSEGALGAMQDKIDRRNEAQGATVLEGVRGLEQQ